jgi:hypothetical protein
VRGREQPREMAFQGALKDDESDDIEKMVDEIDAH